MMKQLSAHDIAQWFVAWADEIEDAVITPLKVQKLLYYAKGHFMDNTSGIPLFTDRMEAWSHGPVIPEVYHELKKYGKSPVDPDEFAGDDFDWDDYRDIEETLIEVWQRYGIYSAWALRNKTHEEEPWRKNFKDGYANVEISDSDLKEFFC